MDDLDRRLWDAGEQWRRALPAMPAGDIILPSAHESARRFAAGGLSMALLTSVVLVGTALVARAPAIGSATCDVTVPTADFVPPDPFPRTPTEEGTARWFGTPDLWTMLQADGDHWTRGVVAPHKINRKLFWWSSHWSPSSEPVPAITVSAERLDGDGSATGDGATNASAGFGTAMLVGLELPTTGCWRITGRYHDTELSFVVRATDD
jgi:hypothetical protein